MYPIMLSLRLICVFGQFNAYELNEFVVVVFFCVDKDLDRDKKKGVRTNSSMLMSIITL